MKIKTLIVAGVLAVSGLVYAWLPAGDAMAKYQDKVCEAAPERRREIAELMAMLGKLCGKQDFRTIEKGFVMTAAERHAVKMLDGADPVAESLTLLRDCYKKIDWSKFEVNSYQNNPNRFEVAAQSATGERLLRLTFRRQQSSYFLVSVTGV